MSKYCWEEGTIKIPSRSWASFKKELREVYNRLQKKSYKVALQAYETLLKAGKGKRGIDWKNEFNRLLWDGHIHIPDGVDILKLRKSIFPFDPKKQENRKRPRKPKKKDFPLANSSTTRLELDGDAHILFDNKTRSVSWVVYENNHAVENARAHPLGIAFFRALDKMKWTRGTGGEIIGNDEYNRESRDAGGGGNYITAIYGTNTDKGLPNLQLLRSLEYSRIRIYL